MLLIWHLPAMTEYQRKNENILTLQECEASSFGLLCTRINKQESCMNSKKHPSVLTHFRDKEEFRPKCLTVFSTKQKTAALLPHTASAYKVYFTSQCFNIRTSKSQRRGVFIPRKAHPAFLQASAIPSLIVSATSTSSLPQAK